jgi:hypothetical protein
MTCIVCRLPRISLSAALIIVFVSMQGTLAAQGREDENLFTRIIEGQAIVINDDLVRTRDSAIRDALRKAVEEAVQLLALESPGLDKLSNPQIEKYIYQYGIISEKQSGIVYRIELKVAVDKGYLKKDFKSQSGENLINEITIDTRGIKRYNDYKGVRDFLAGRTNGKVIPKLLKTNQAIFGYYTDEKIDVVINKLSNMTSATRMKKISSNVLEINVESD